MTLIQTIGIRAAILIAAAAAAFLWHQIDRRAAYSEGRQAERLVWMETRARELAAAEAARAKAQLRINEIERDYLARTRDQAGKIAELERAIADEQQSEPMASSDCTCPPALSRQLRDHLERIGR